MQQIIQSIFLFGWIKTNWTFEDVHSTAADRVLSHADILVHFAWIILCPLRTVGAWTLWSAYRLD